ncbi:MAG: LysE family translocator [Alphaproteobacteria bacterium]|nr:LysE family translocator [Alphaproteobacteria bacterium]
MTSDSITFDLIPSLGTILGFSLASFVLAITPGPDMILFLSRTVTGGRTMGFAAMLGASAGMVVHMTLAAFGLSALLAVSATAFFILKVVGGLYLLWLAYGALRHGSAFCVDREDVPQQSLRATVLTGVGINLTNPKVIVFFVTFLPQFIDAGDAHASGKLMFLGILFLVIGITTNAFIILIAERVTGFMQSSPRAMRYFDYGMAGIMSAFALKLVFTQGR